MTGVFVIVGAELFMSPPLVGCGCSIQTQFLGFTFINLRISNQVTIFTLLSWEASHLEHPYEGLALSPRNAQAPSELGRICLSDAIHYEYLRRATDIAHVWTLRC